MSSPAYVQKFGEYEFPYHHLPWRSPEGGLRMGRVWFMALEYMLYLDSVVEIVLELEPERVLDFGCGDGRLSHELYAHGVSEVVGVDLSERAISFAKAFNWEHRDHFHFADVRSFDTAPFDVVVAMAVFEHISDDDTRDTMAALFRLLRPGGRLVVCVPTTVLARNPDKHYRHYTEESLANQLDPWFELEGAQRVFRPGWRETLLRRLFMNKVLVNNWNAPLERLSRLYRREVLAASVDNGAHLVSVLCRRQNERVADVDLAGTAAERSRSEFGPLATR